MNLRNAAPALAAALLFGASTPLAKWLGTDMPPLLLAGLLYLGSGLGLGLLLVVRGLIDGGTGKLSVPRGDWPWLLGAVAAGGMLGPAFLMAGLATTDAAPAALLLNVEGVLTALIAWLVFRESTDRRIVAGMLSIVAGGTLLALQPGELRFSSGALLIVAACLCWAVDNNLTRQVSANDAVLLACIKGALAGVCNTALALFGGARLPAWPVPGWALLVGFVGYGLSLTLFVLALRALGTARTGAYFSAAPLFGVLVAWAIWPVAPSWAFWPAAGLMGLGLWLHLRERHEHDHVHDELTHGHPHTHDAHHRHPHDFAWNGEEPHVHPHRHAPLRHRHAHQPDIHHRHRH